MRIVQIGAVAALLFGTVALVGVGRPGSAHGSSAPAGRGVTVTGTATVHAVPNQADFSFGVSTTGASARQAAAANAERAQKVIAALREAGVAKDDLKTQDVSVSPNWSGEGSRVEGFTAHSSVQAWVRGIAHAGAAVDAAVAAGATDTSGPSFDRSDRDELYRSALRGAFAQARAKAETLAVEADARLGRVLRIEEATEQPVVPYYGPAATEAAQAKTPIEPGTEDVQASVTVTFALA